MNKIIKKRQSFTMAYLMAICGSMTSFSEKQPTAYSYNGVVLPKLPEWDKTVYPYATIAFYNESDPNLGAVCYYSKLPKCDVSANGYFPYTLHFSEPFEYIIYLFYAKNDPFDYNQQGPYAKDAGELLLPNGMSAISGERSPWWSNFDIYDLEGNLVLAASEPVPIYE